MPAADLSLPVLWTEGGGAAHAGRLDLEPGRLRLAGGPRGAERALEIPFAEIASVRTARAEAERLRGRQALVLTRHDGTTVAIATLDRPSTLPELAERIERALAR